MIYDVRYWSFENNDFDYLIFKALKNLALFAPICFMTFYLFPLSSLTIPLIVALFGTPSPWQSGKKICAFKKLERFMLNKYIILAIFWGCFLRFVRLFWAFLTYKNDKGRVLLIAPGFFFWNVMIVIGLFLTLRIFA